VSVVGWLYNKALSRLSRKRSSLCPRFSSLFSSSFSLFSLLSSLLSLSLSLSLSLFSLSLSLAHSILSSSLSFNAPSLREKALLVVSSLVGFLPLLLLLLEVTSSLPSPYEVFFALVHAFNWVLLLLSLLSLSSFSLSSLSLLALFSLFLQHTGVHSK